MTHRERMLDRIKNVLRPIPESDAKALIELRLENSNEDILFNILEYLNIESEQLERRINESILDMTEAVIQ